MYHVAIKLRKRSQLQVAKQQVVDGLTRRNRGRNRCKFASKVSDRTQTPAARSSYASRTPSRTRQTASCCQVCGPDSRQRLYRFTAHLWLLTLQKAIPVMTPPLQNVTSQGTEPRGRTCRNSPEDNDGGQLVPASDFADDKVRRQFKDDCGMSRVSRMNSQALKLLLPALGGRTHCTGRRRCN